LGAVRIVVAGDDGTAADSLGEWLSGEHGLRGRVRRTAPAPRPGEMGSLGELVVEGAVTGAIGTVAGLLGQSLSVWLTERRARSAPAVTVTLTTADGRTAAVTAADPAEAERLVRELVGETGTDPAAPGTGTPPAPADGP
jgi:hypothetical protein